MASNFPPERWTAVTDGWNHMQQVMAVYIPYRLNRVKHYAYGFRSLRRGHG
jgi:hypothetical protein